MAYNVIIFNDQQGASYSKVPYSRAKATMRVNERFHKTFPSMFAFYTNVYTNLKYLYLNSCSAWLKIYVT